MNQLLGDHVIDQKLNKYLQQLLQDESIDINEVFVYELCQKLEHLRRFSDEEIKLFRDEVELDKKQTLGQLGIQKGCQLQAKIIYKTLPEPGSINITVDISQINRNFSLNVSSDDKVQIIKHLIGQYLGIYDDDIQN